VLVVLAIAACGGGHAATTTGTSTKAHHSAGKAVVNPHYGAPGASVSFVAPKEGSTVSDPVHVRVAVKGFKLDPTGLDKRPRKGYGNLHFRMDGGRYDAPRYAGANGKLAVRLGVAGKYAVAVTPSITYARLPPGRHTLVVSLANNDLSETGVRAVVVFTVR
jgi:hypothetical protein